MSFLIAQLQIADTGLCIYDVRVRMSVMLLTTLPTLDVVHARTHACDLQPGNEIRHKTVRNPARVRCLLACV